MPPLPELQAAMRAVLRGGEMPSVLNDAISADGLSAASRLGIYRNHFRVSLIDALAASFPVVRRLVGEAFFRAIARRFVDTTPPRSPCLSEYGAEFPAFLGECAETRVLPYLGDVARLEWLVMAAENAADQPVLSATALAAMSPGAITGARFTLHPSVGLIASNFPIAQIWAANQECNQECTAAAETIDLSGGGVHLLVHRCGGEVGWLVLPAAEFAFITLLKHGASFVAAIETAGGVADLPALFGALLEGGVFSEIRVGDVDENEELR
ncbi:MAG: putative DNA-binding domain-containing protein [Rhodospirillales bacterium]|nr:putative DNA-binding domain-containing protein [Rhodospirillales bacterium]